MTDMNYAIAESEPLSWNAFWPLRRILVLLSVAALVVAGTVLVILSVPKIYSATGSVIIGEQEPSSDASAAHVQKLGDPADLESQLLVIRSPALLRLVVSDPANYSLVAEECEAASQSRAARMFLGGPRDCSKLAVGNDDAVAFVQNRYTVKAVGRSRVISVGFQALNPESAKTLANALINAYLTELRKADAEEKEASANELWSEVRRLDQELKSADGEIEDFRSRAGLVRGASSGLTAERLTSANQQLALAEANAAKAEARVIEMRNGDGRAALDNTVIGFIKQQLASVNSRIGSLSTMVKAKHPSLRALLEQKAELEASLAVEIERIKTGADRAAVAAAARVERTQRQLDQLKAEAEDLAQKEATLANMIRNAEAKRTAYSDYYKKASDLDRERRASIGKARIVNLADVPQLPIFPKRVPLGVAGITIGLILGYAASLLFRRSRR